MLERATREERGGQSSYTEAYSRMKSHSAVTDDFETHLAQNGSGYLDPDLVEQSAQLRENWAPLVKPLSFADPDLIEHFAAAAGDTVSWMKGFGVRFDNFKRRRAHPCDGGYADYRESRRRRGGQITEPEL